MCVACQKKRPGCRVLAVKGPSFVPMAQEVISGEMNEIDPALVDAAIDQFDAVWAGFRCKDCGRRQFCPDPVAGE